MSTAKHFMFCSGPMGSQPVTALPGIGATYGSRLNQEGYYMARDIYEKFKSFNFDSGCCQGWLYSVCNANSRYSSMCYEALKEWHQQFGEKSCSPNQQSYQQNRNELLEFDFLPKPSLQLAPERIVHSPVQQSPAGSRGSDISKAEVMQMMAEFKKKQDAMAAQISNLEQEKLTADTRIKILETKIELMDKKAVELQKRYDVKITALTEKSRIMDRIEQYKNITSSIYLLSQKFDEILAELNKAKQISTINSYVKFLETKIVEIERNVIKLQKQQDGHLLTMTNKINNSNTPDRHKEVSSSINLLAQKLDDIKKQQSEPKQDIASIQKSLDTKIKHVKQDFQNLTIEMRSVQKKNTETKAGLSTSDIQLIEIPNVPKNHNFFTNHTNKTIAQLKGAEFPTVDLKDEIVEQVKLFNEQHDNSKVNNSNLKLQS